MPRKRCRSTDKIVTSRRKKTKVESECSEIPLSMKTEFVSSWMFDLLTDPDWKSKLIPLFKREYFQKVESWLQTQYQEHGVRPPKHLIFNAFNLTSFVSVKVVLIGQDPYHDDNQAHGLAFSVPKGVAIPPSLRNIYKELKTDIPGFQAPSHGCLETWTQQGVLLLNATLTVEAHKPNSHARCGWWEFTDDVIRVISNYGKPCVFLLWGGFAHKKASLIDETRHRIIKTAHPSPLSFNKFKNCHCFSGVNTLLKDLGREAVNWNLPD